MKGGEDAPRPGGTGASRAEGGGREDPGPEDPPLAKRGDLLPLGRGFAENRRTQGTGQRWGYHVAGPGRNPSRKGDALLARGSAVRIPGGLWPSALFRGAAKTQGVGGRRAIRRLQRRQGAPEPREARLREAPERSPHRPTREYAKGMHKPSLFPSTGGRRGGTAREGLRGGTGGKADKESDDRE